ncbi:hypothetical protein EKO27_g8178, partial [Xylaria grammica]
GRAVGDELTRGLAWRGGLPPSHIHVLPDSLRGLSGAQRRGLRMEALLFGTDERHEDPATVATRLVRISASGDASRVELTFAGDPGQTATIVRAIGPDRKSPLKSMDIDGPGGETIASILMPPMPSEDTGFEWYVPQWFGIVTSRGRQGIFGQQASINQASPIKPPSGFDVVGLHAILDPGRLDRAHGLIFIPRSSRGGPTRRTRPYLGPAATAAGLVSLRAVRGQRRQRHKEPRRQPYTARARGQEQGVRIVAVHVWGGGYLHGIQFEMENGARSPKWGKAGGEPSISFRAHAASGGTFSTLQDPARNIASAKETGKSIRGIVGLKFVIRKSSGFGSGVPGPVIVQGFTRP